MIIKVTAIVAVFSTFQLIEVHGMELCSFTPNLEKKYCDFTSKNQTECLETATTLKRQFGCEFAIGNGCFTSIRICKGDVTAKFDSYCAELGGFITKLEDTNVKSGICEPLSTDNRDELY